MNHYFELLTDYFAANPLIALGIVFLIAMGEALFIIGLVVPSTVVLVSAGTLVGMGKLDFSPVLIATILGAIAGDAISYWVGRKWEHQVKAIWPFNRYTFLMAKGEIFFAKHGGKSVFIGRFIPGIKSVVPGIAGIMGMNAWHFTVVNVVSAVFWSLAHLLPGVVVGRGLDVAQTSNPRLFVLLIIIAMVGFSAWYSFKILASIIFPYFWKARRKLAARLAFRKSVLGKWSARILMNRGYVVTSHTYAILATLSAIGFAILSFLIFHDVKLVNTDGALASYMASLRTETLDPLMVSVGLLGSKLVLLSVSLAMVVALLWMKRWWLSALILGSVIVSNFAIPPIKGFFARERPFNVHPIALESFSFPSHQATMSLVVFGLAASLLAWHLTPYIRRYIYLFFLSLISMTGFSRLYLQAHWPSDILGATFLGTIFIFVTLYVMTKVDRLNPNLHKLNSWKMGVLVLIALAGSMTYQINAKLDVELAKNKIEVVREVVSESVWITKDWKNVPLARTLFDGDVAEPMIIQTDLSIDQLAIRLKKVGWKKSQLGALTILADSLIPSRTSLHKRSVLPSTNAGQPPEIVFYKEVSPTSRTVLRAWRTNYSIEGKDLITLSLMLEQQREIPLGFSFVTKKQINSLASKEISRSIETALSCQKIEKNAGQQSVSLLVCE